MRRVSLSVATLAMVTCAQAQDLATEVKSTEVVPGVYMLELEFWADTPLLVTSEPFWMVYNLDADPREALPLEEPFGEDARLLTEAADPQGIEHPQHFAQPDAELLHRAMQSGRHYSRSSLPVSRRKSDSRFGRASVVSWMLAPVPASALSSSGSLLLAISAAS